MELIIFVITGLTAVGASLSVVLSKNPVTSVLSLVLAFFCLAVLYVLLGAPFIAALQVIVYAGAIMVLFLFVVMLLNMREKQDWDVTGQARRWLGVAAAAGVLLVAIAGVKGAFSPASGLDPTLGTAANVGKALYTRFLLPFEIASVLLLIAIVGVVAMLKRGGTSIERGKESN